MGAVRAAVKEHRECSFLVDTRASNGAVSALGLRSVAVGTAIADRPPHRSVRALLTHTAPTSDIWRQSERRGMDAPAGDGAASGYTVDRSGPQ
jgi:hypothetical protein